MVKKFLLIHFIPLSEYSWEVMLYTQPEAPSLFPHPSLDGVLFYASDKHWQVK
jgi:hypothetical protein